MARLFYMIMEESQMGNQICMRPLTYVTDGVGIIRLIWPGNISMQNKGSKLPVREAGKGRMHVHVSTNKRQGSRMVVSIINTGDDLIKIKEREATAWMNGPCEESG